VEETRLARASYQELREKLSVNPYNGDIQDDPLSQEAEVKMLCIVRLRQIGLSGQVRFIQTKLG
jgi:hypothetical protein